MPRATGAAGESAAIVQIGAYSYRNASAGFALAARLATGDGQGRDGERQQPASDAMLARPQGMQRPEEEDVFSFE